MEVDSKGTRLFLIIAGSAVGWFLGGVIGFRLGVWIDCGVGVECIMPLNGIVLALLLSIVGAVAAVVAINGRVKVAKGDEHGD